MDYKILSWIWSIEASAASISIPSPIYKFAYKAQIPCINKGSDVIILLNTAYEICSWDTIENTALIYNAIKCIGDEPSTNDLQRFLRHFERY